MHYYSYFPIDCFEGRIEDIKETHGLNDADLVKAAERAFKKAGALIALSGDWRINDCFLGDITNAASYERVKVRSFLFNAALTGAKSYLDSIETEQFEMKPVDDGPGSSEEDMKDATAEMFYLLNDRLF